MNTRVLIVDDHWAIRQALTDVVSRCEGLELMGQAEDGQQALDMVEQLHPDLVVLDVNLPVVRGMEVLRQIRARAWATKVLIFSMYPADPYAEMARRWGAQGFLAKDANAQSIMQALLKVAASGTSFPDRGVIGLKATEAKRRIPTLESLSRREVQVFQALVRGEPNKDIAARLNISPKSVSTYRDRLFTKLQVNSIAQLCALAAEDTI